MGYFKKWKPSKTRIIEIYKNLKAGKKLDGFGNVKRGGL